MPNTEPFTDQDLTNIVRGFDAPAKQDLLEKLLSQAKERDKVINERAEENSILEDFYNELDDERKRGDGLDR